MRLWYGSYGFGLQQGLTASLVGARQCLGIQCPCLGWYRVRMKHDELLDQGMTETEEPEETVIELN